MRLSASCATLIGKAKTSSDHFSSSLPLLSSSDTPGLFAGNKLGQWTVTRPLSQDSGVYEASLREFHASYRKETTNLE